MMKYKKTIILTSIIVVLPMIAGLILWKQLPDTMAVHFGTDNSPNGWSSKPFAVIGLPMLMLAVHLICVGITLNDPKRKNISEKMKGLIFWIVPVVSLICNISIYMAALGKKINIGMITGCAVGFVFVLVGNYMPKLKQNYTVGIKLPWTLSSEENWNKTHHLAGWLWILAGTALMAAGILDVGNAVIVVILAIMLIPAAYSFILYKKGI